jgi:hypothetical protein
MTALNNIQKTILADQLFTCYDCSLYSKCELYGQRNNRICQQFIAPEIGRRSELYQTALKELNNI